ncbi:MAG: hypothetical protein WBC73_09510, partial [Phormidesmis sp.]
MVDQHNAELVLAEDSVQGVTLSYDDLAQRLEQYSLLKQDLTAFVLDAEGDIAIALEAFSAEQLGRWAKPSLSGLNRSELAVDMFLTEGHVGDQSIIERFIQSAADLPVETQAWLRQWQGSFHGLFVVRGSSDEGYWLTNWLTEKGYRVRANPSQTVETLARMHPGEIVLARLSPLVEAEWVFSGPLTLLGKLGKPKLAVAIGNFRQWFPQYLYGDAPALKEAAWQSVKQHYEDFVAFFGAEQITLSGYELNQKLQTYQAQITEKQLADAGIDSSKSLQDMAKEAGLSEEEVAEAMDAVGEDSKVARQLLENGRSLKMIMPEVSLPDELLRAEVVSVFVHPRWGQTFLKDYCQLETLLADQETGESDQAAKKAADLDRLVLKYLENEQVNAYVWQGLAETHGSQIERSLRRVLGNPEFDVKQDLAGAIARYGKPLIPELPETASVPIHLHNLFQEALRSVNKGTQKQIGAEAGAKRSR